MHRALRGLGCKVGTRSPCRQDRDLEETAGQPKECSSRELHTKGSMPMNKKLAAVIRKYQSHPEFLGVDLVDPNQRGAIDDALLHLAARTGAVEDIEVLVSSGAKVNLAGDLGNTPLHQAAMCGHVGSVQTLLQLGSDPSIRNEYGQTALQVAELGGYDHVVNILKKQAAKDC